MDFVKERVFFYLEVSITYLISLPIRRKMYFLNSTTLMEKRLVTSYNNT